MNLLVRTPPPKQSESLLGYVLRVCETNGYDSPWHIFRLSGIAQGHMLEATLPAQKLAAPLGFPPDRLDHLAFCTRTENGNHEYRLLGHPLGFGLNAAPFRLATPALCPDCVQELGFVDAFYELSYAVACPKHHRVLISCCPHCARELSWFRPGLLRCKCGGLLGEAPFVGSDSATSTLMMVVWARLHKCEFPADRKDGFPPQLCNLSLKELLHTITVLGTARGARARDGALQIVTCAASALSNWPQGFYKLLDECKPCDGAHSLALRKRYENLYIRLFKRRGRSTNPLGWVRKAFVEYGMSRANDAIVDVRLMSHGQGARRFVSKSELARVLSVRPVTITRWAREGLIPIDRYELDGNNRYIADLSQEEFRSDGWNCGHVLETRAAAARLEIPVNVLKALKPSEHFTHRSRLKLKRRGFHESDVVAFKQRMIDSAGVINSQPQPKEAFVSLYEVLAHYRLHSVEGKTKFLLQYLKGSIRSVGRTADSTRGIWFSRGEIKAFVSSARSTASGNSYSQQEAAQMIGCDYELIAGLARMCLLVAVQGREGIRVTRTSVQRFCARHLPLKHVANDLRTTSRKLQRICETNSIPLLFTRRAYRSSPSAFIPLARVEDLKAALS